MRKARVARGQIAPQGSERLDLPRRPLVVREAWHGCYDGSWRGLIVPEAFAHPAKMARGLVARIYDELFTMGALSRGLICVDPFGGIGTTAIEGTMRGVRVFCNELEPKFCALAGQNYELHRALWLAQGRVLPVTVQGDSRHLRASLSLVLADALVSSPPYVAIASGAGGLNTKPPKHAGQQGGRSAAASSQDTDQRYGESAGQLARLPEGTVDAVVSSPPFATSDSASAQSITTRTDKSAEWVKRNCGSAATEGYGASDGQLGVMALGDVVDALVSSPPWEKGAEGKVGAHKFKDPAAFAAAMSASDGTKPNRHATSVEARVRQFERDNGASYGDSPEQLGNVSGDTFWHAARDIVAESFAILKPGGVAVWVVKHYVKKGRIVDFPGDWRRLCEHVGFVTEREAHAMLVAEESRTDLISGDVITTKRERKSFFRRLAEKKGSPRIDFETVYFMRKPFAEDSVA